MKAQKYENVEFVINHAGDEGIKLSLIWRKGGLYLSLSGLFLTDGSTWYELPVKDLENISVVSDEPLKLRLKIPSLDIMISGQRAERLLALRHFLLPSISDVGDSDKLKSLLRFRALGIKETDLLSKLLNVEPQMVEELTGIAREKGFMHLDGKLTDTGDMFIQPSQEEG
ncbi:MAG: hypothetical protein KKH41_07970 [Candidatus Thermoplasmatota archaeon]|nr:hypothetical protein [Euryarchaeota archaeon]MBU4032024.1 hypothetical protein [Candidatus Thermoplasmatota archaeon]MBU4071627.1 hypothetical protein [Candidatus Thermoplasmatota archaeon]MBU4143887.1 hypothetical protein [Candidatus Thermoplasmatota archaeon]MBU4592504.1 hypothetical protein [Candidatus Thermoplasmatota archaeon]